MSRIFLSHSSRDNFEAVALGEWLASAGWDDVFLDLDPDRGIAAGERWERALHSAATRCQAVVFLVSRNWLKSDWCFTEYALARGLNKKLFAALIDPGLTIAELPEALTGVWQVVDLAGGQDLRLFPTAVPGSHEEKHVPLSASGLLRLRRGLEKAGLDPRFFAWPPEHEPNRAPYPGLKPLEAEDAGVFFGRGAPIVEATDRLRGVGAGAPPRIFVILGASGAGKSSFLRAGLLPRLARDDAHFLPLPPLRPERAALFGETGLVASLAAAFPDKGRAELRAAVQAGAAGVKPLLAELVSASLASRVAGGESARPPAVLIAIDQAEELFRGQGREEGDALLTILAALAAGDDPAVIVVFAIRSDAYDALQNAQPLKDLRQITQPLLPMPRGAYAEVIEGPARRLAEAGGKLDIAPALTERLLADIEAGGGTDALPLLAFTLEQLYLDYGRAGAVKLADYEAFGGLKGAIDAAVERALKRADADPRIPKDRDARLILLRRGLIPWLAGVDPDTKSPRRNIARRSDIPAEAAPLIDLLVEERLLTADTRTERGPLGDQTRVATIEPTHEALLRQWGLLEGWLKDDFALLATLEAVKRASADWDANQRDPAWLAHRGPRLADAGALDERPDIAAKLDATDRAYLAGCRARETTEAAEADARRKERDEAQARALRDAQEIAASNRRFARRTRTGLIAALVLAAIALVGGAIAWHETGVATQQADIAAQRAEEADRERGKAVTAASEAEKSRYAEAKAAAVAEANAKRANAVDAEVALQAEKLASTAAQRNQSAALAALSGVALARNPAIAVKLALAAWPRSKSDATPKVPKAMSALGDAITQLRERREFRGHADVVYSAYFSPDGARVVTASRDGTARVWDSVSGQTLAILKGHLDAVNSAAFSPDGGRVITASDDGTARVWDLVSGQTLAILKGHQDAVKSAVFSPDGGRVITASRDGTARVWDASSGQGVAIVRAQGASPDVFISPNGMRTLIYYSDNTVEVLETLTGRRLAVISNFERGLSWSSVFSSDYTRVVQYSGSTARVRELASGKILAVLKGHNADVSNATFSPDGTRVVTASQDSTARVWDAATGQTVAVLIGHAARVFSASFSRDGTHVLTVSADRTARVWDAVTGESSAILKGSAALYDYATFSPDGSRVLTVSFDYVAQIWDVGTGESLANIKGHEDRVWSAVFSPDGARVVTASSDKTARVWSATTGQSLATLEGHSSFVTDAAFSPDGTRIVTASSDNTARVWDAVTGRNLAILEGHTSVVSSAVYSSDGARVVTASSDGTARVWDAVTGRGLVTLAGHKEALLTALFSPDGNRVLTTSWDGTARIWESATGSVLAILKGHKDAVFGAAFSPDGTQVVTASRDGTARIWDATTGRSLAILKGHDGYVNGAAFSPDGARVVTASNDQTARIWDSATGQTVAILNGHEEVVFMAVFSPDGGRIVTASADSTARVWDSATGQSLIILKNRDGLVDKVALSLDGKRAVTTSQEAKFARVWDLSSIPKGDIFDVACALVPDTDLADISKGYDLPDLKPICTDAPPLPDWVGK